MSDDGYTPKSVIDETWEFCERDHTNPDAGARIYSDGCEEEWATTWGGDMQRPKLAAQAPRMARLLAKLYAEGADNSDEEYRPRCPFCPARWSWEGKPLPEHAPDCELAACLRDAGVL